MAAILPVAPVLASEMTLEATAGCSRIETETERREHEREAGVTAVSDEIASTVLRVTLKRPNPHVLELENGQKWRLLESSDLAPFRAGDHVVVRRGAIGSCRATAEERPGAWRVRRVE